MQPLQTEHNELSLRSLLSRQLASLRPSEQQAASFLLYDQRGKSADWKLDDLAQAAGTTPSAIVRMCQALGFAGFRDFRLRWAAEHVAQPGHATDLHLLAPAVEALHETARLLDPEQVAEAARRITSADHVLIHGQGGSGHMARVAASALTVLGRLALHLDSSERDSLTLPAGDGTTIIIVSHRGTHAALAQFTRRCRTQGATTIAITAGLKSPLATEAHIVLPTGAPVVNDRRRLEEAPARVAQMAVIQALVHAVTQNMEAQRA